MKHIKQIIDNPQSSYTGSIATKDLVKKQIENRWGKKEAERYDPFKNCFTFAKWASMGFRIKPWEKSLKSVTFVEGDKESATGKVTKWKKTVHLFFDLQVHKGGY